MHYRYRTSYGIKLLASEYLTDQVPVISKQRHVEQRYEAASFLVPGDDGAGGAAQLP